MSALSVVKRKRVNRPTKWLWLSRKMRVTQAFTATVVLLLAASPNESAGTPQIGCSIIDCDPFSVVREGMQTPTPTVVFPPCVGDCDGDGMVSAEEENLCRSRDPARCPACDSNMDGVVSQGEVVAAINFRISGCPGRPRSPTASPERTVGAVRTATDTPSPIETVSVPPVCTGDCSNDGRVSVDEIVRGVNIALGLLPLDVCPNSDANGDASVTVDELIRAVEDALHQCAS
jgi:hypothetical protein